MQQQQTEQEVSTTNESGGTMTREAFAAKMNELAEAERPDESSTGGDPAADTPETGAEAGGDPKEKPSLKTLGDLAEKLGVEVKDLYGIEFTNAKGETRTIGAFKDLLASQEEVTARELALEEQRTATETELLRAKRDLETILGAVPKGSLPKDILEKARAERIKAEEIERERVLEVFPEWSDEEREERDRALAVEHMQQYGYDKADLDRLIDHRMIKYVVDNAKRWQRVQKALEGIKPDRQPPKGQQRSKPNNGPRKTPAANPKPSDRPLTSSQLRDRFAQLR